MRHCNCGTVRRASRRHCRDHSNYTGLRLFLHRASLYLVLYDAPGDSVTLALFLLLGIAITAVVEKFNRTKEHLRQTVLELRQSELRLRTLAQTVPEALFTATSEGDCDYVSQSFCDYTGLEPKRAPTDWSQVIHPEDRPSVARRWAKSLDTETDFEATYRLRRSDGKYRWFMSHAKPVREPDGKITKWSGVCADIHEHKLLEEALARRTEELGASNEEFQRFAYRFCHDLKEPLRMIGIYTELLAERNRDKMDIDCRTFTLYVLDGVDRIENQMRQLLEYATAGSFEVKCELIDFNVILESAITDLCARIVETGATVSHDTLPSLIANSDRIQSIFENLIGNALKYRSAYPPRIHISAGLRNDDWFFSVQDNGIEFEMQYAETIFAPFERLSANARIQGSGLGLAIVKRIVELQGGRVWAESEAGKGSTFYFSLPRSLEKISMGQLRARAARVP